MSSYVSCRPEEPSFITVYSPSSQRISVAAPKPTAIDQDGSRPRLVRCNASASSPDTRSFFRTPTGVAAIVLMVAGAAFVAYRIPKDNQKVHSPIR